jgi:aldehyde:ferredoxin oxidoreductase
MYGLTGNILRVNLTKEQISIIKTADYREWIAGHGLGAAIFFDLVKDKSVSAFDSRNVLVIAPGLFSGTLVPAACRTELVGIQSQSYPYEWFSRSNVGGRFANMVKYAGYDAIVLEGAASRPVWINIVEGEVELCDAEYLWGMDTYETQTVVFKKVIGSGGLGKWTKTRGRRQTTQMPSVLCIGPAGENRSRIATIQTDAGNAFGQGGFGGVWGAKNLKAISVWGTGSVDVANPRGLMEARLWAQQNYGADFDNPIIHDWQEFITSHFGGHPNRRWTPFDAQRRASGCHGCHLNCKPRTSTGFANESICANTLFYQKYDRERHGEVTEVSGKAANLFQKYGINVFEFRHTLDYLRTLHDQGALGRGKDIDTDLSLDKIGEAEFIEDLCHKIAFRKDIGNDLAEGFPRAAERWGRIDEDLKTGLLNAMFWGYTRHYDTRTEVYWGYASLVTGRDINCHDFNVPAFWMPNLDIPQGKRPVMTAEEVANIMGEMAPFHDPEMMNFATHNIYSEHMAKTVAWLLRYSTFWKQSCGLCDNAFADFINPYGPNNRGLTPWGELKFYEAVSGEKITFEESMEFGRRMCNLDKAILTLQGRHRDMEEFPEYVYSVPTEGLSYLPGKPPTYYMCTKVGGRWDFRDVAPRHLDKEKVEEWKGLYYAMEGWDPKTGWQKKSTIEDLGLGHVTKELDAAGKLP